MVQHSAELSSSINAPKEKENLIKFGKLHGGLICRPQISSRLRRSWLLWFNDPRVCCCVVIPACGALAPHTIVHLTA
jgi:hypothetical protein